MVKLIRHYRQPLMVAITVLMLIPFLWLYNRSSINERFKAGSVQLFGKNYSINTFKHSAELLGLCQQLGLGELPQAVLGQMGYYQLMLGRAPQEAYQEFAVTDLVLRHEAERLGIEPTEEEIFQEIQKLPAFRSDDGQFDPMRYNAFISDQDLDSKKLRSAHLGARGLEPSAIEETVRDYLRLMKIKEMLRSAVIPTPSEVREMYEQGYRKTEASVVRLKLEDFKATVQITDDDLKKLYDEKKDTLKTAEKRKVKYVDFTLDSKKTLAPAERADALAKLLDQVTNFTAKMTEKDAKLDEVAAQFGATVKESAEFEESKPPEGLDGTAAEAAFKLTKEQPNSDPLVSGKRDGYRALQLTEIIPNRPLTLDEAKAQLTDQLKQERSQEAMNLKATEIRNKIEADLKAGKSFADAATAVGVKAESIPPFSRQDRGENTPDSGQVMGAAEDLHEGDLSKFEPTATGGFILHIDKRQPIDEADFEKKKLELTQQVADGMTGLLLSEWLQQRVKDAKFSVAGGA